MKKYLDFYKEHKGYISDKWIHYLFIYQDLLEKYIEKGKPVNLLEIGVQNGGSIQVWEKYLPKGSKIYGIDIDKKCCDLKFGKNTEFVLGDASSKKFWKKNLKDVKFDIILDDGSHINKEIIDTFNILFRDKLKDGGIYIAEDLHTSYWKENYNGGFRKPGAAVEFFKDLIDSQAVNYFQRKDKNISSKDKKVLKELNPMIKRISFYDSICAIEKYEKKLKDVFEAYVVGDKTLVNEDVKNARKTLTTTEINKYKKYWEK